jgi:hypothetical protein
MQRGGVQRAARRRAVERGKGERAHLGETQRGAAQRVRRPARRRRRRSGRGAAPTAATTRRRARSWARKLGNRAEKLCNWREKTARRAVVSLKFRTGVTKKKHSGRPDAWPSWQRRRARNRPHARDAVACAQRTQDGPRRWARWLGRKPRSWGRGRRARAGPGAGLAGQATAGKLGRARAGPRRERWRWAERGGGKRGGRGRGGPPNGLGKGRGLISISPFLSLFLSLFPIILV